MRFVEAYHDVLRFSNFSDTAATIALTQNKPNFIGSITIPAGQGLELGFGPYASLDTAVGRIFADLNDSTDADLKGKLRVSVWDEEDRPVRIIGTWDAAQLNQSTLTNRQPLAESGVILTEDKKVVLEFIPYEASKTFKLSGSDLLISCTKYKAIRD